MMMWTPVNILRVMGHQMRLWDAVAIYFDNEERLRIVRKAPSGRPYVWWSWWVQTKIWLLQKGEISSSANPSNSYKTEGFWVLYNRLKRNLRKEGELNDEA